jgi:hypothetical protein
VFDGLADDSYAVNVASSGDFTAAVSYLGYPIFFKEDKVYKVYGSKPSDYQVMSSASLGVKRGAAASLANVESIQWQDIYAEDSNGYKFRSVDMAQIPSNPLHVTEIYRVKLKDIQNANDAAQCVDMVITVLDMKDIHLDKVTFEFTLGEDLILFTTNTDTVLGTTYDILEILFTRVNSNEDEGNLFYRNPDSKAKIIEYIKP